MSMKPSRRHQSREGELLDYAAAGALLGFSGRTVRRMVESGKFIDAVSVPGVRGPRLRRADILVWLQSIPAHKPGNSAPASD